MPIVHFTSKFNELPADAKNVEFQGPGFNLNDTAEKAAKLAYLGYGPYVIITHETHHGLCIKEYEHNSYHDSDFYMLIWNEEKGDVDRYCFASTRGWSYPSYASRPDATPEVMAKYEAMIAAGERRNRICGKWARRAKKVQIARAIGETNYRNLRKLEAVVPGGKWDATINLITSTRLRSSFKISLRDQILRWYRDPSPKFQTPLSRKQWEYV